MAQKPPIIKKWVCSPHAIKRMQDRSISVETLDQVLREPDERISQGPKWIFAKEISGRFDNHLAAVILERKEVNLWVVITVLVNFKKK